MKKALLVERNDQSMSAVFATPTFDSGTWQVTIPVYLDPSYLATNRFASEELALSNLILRAIFYTFQTPPLMNLSPSPLNAFYAALGELVDTPVVRIKKPHSIFRLIRFALVPTAYAATNCTGFVQCGTPVVSDFGYCVVDGVEHTEIDCMNNQDCNNYNPIADTCRFPASCVYDPGVQQDPPEIPCPDYKRANQCYSSSNAFLFPQQCSGCTISSSCASVSGPPTSTPTPGPTAPPPGATPTPVSSECSTGTLCDSTWSGQCCDSGCAHTWVDGVFACTGPGPTSPPAPPCDAPSWCPGSANGTNCLRNCVGECYNSNEGRSQGGNWCDQFDNYNYCNRFEDGGVTAHCGGAACENWAQDWGSCNNACECSCSCPPPTATPAPTATPTPVPATIRARAKQVSSSELNCNAVENSPNYTTPVTFTLAPGVAPGSQIQTGSSYVSWSAAGGTYTLIENAPFNSVLRMVCWSRTATAPTTGQGLSAYAAFAETLTWNLGYTLGKSWVQVRGADAYAATTLKSYVPNSATDRVFIQDGDGGYPGIATHGSDTPYPGYDFNSRVNQEGEDRVSSTGWLVDGQADTTNYYKLFYNRLGGNPVAIDYDSPVTPVPQPASRTTPYYVTGNLTTSGDWAIPDGEKLIMVITGDLTIEGTITTTGSGIAVFIVNGNITVSSDVGVPSDSETPVLMGIYVTSPTGTFSTGLSTVSQKERFVGKGTFVAGTFLLQRDLESVGANNTTAAELFLYDPQIVLTMPDAMKDYPILWKEVAP